MSPLMTVPRSGIMIQLHILKDITDKENNEKNNTTE